MPCCAGYGHTKFHRNQNPSWIVLVFLCLKCGDSKKGSSVELAKKYKITWPIAYDLNMIMFYAVKNGVTITKSLATQMAIAFCEERLNVWDIPMANLDYLN